MDNSKRGGGIVLCMDRNFERKNNFKKGTLPTKVVLNIFEVMVIFLK